MKKLLIIALYDSFIKSSLYIAKEFKRNNYDIDFFLGVEKDDKNHFQEIGLNYQYTVGNLFSIFETQEIFKYTAIMLSDVGPNIYWFIHAYKTYIKKQDIDMRPVIFTGYVGIVYEYYYKGFFDRQGADVFFLNSNNDYQLFSSYLDTVSIKNDNLVVTGLPYLDVLSKKKRERKRNNAILFAGQPTVPVTLQQRSFIVKSLLEFSKANPDIKVYLKPRHKLHQTTFHKVSFHYEKILKSLKKKMDIPSNFLLVYDHIDILLEKVDYCLTVSSTVAFEALSMSKNVGIISDFGITEKNGNHFLS